MSKGPETAFEGNVQGRDDLLAWDAAQPDNFYVSDPHFRRILPLYAGERLARIEEDLVRFGGECAQSVDALVRENNVHANNPRLERYTGLGVRVEKIEHHPTYHAAGAYIYGSGVMEAYGDAPNSIGVLSRFYVSSYLGEAGHNCPLACTAGVIRVLQELGSEELKAKYLPRFLDRAYDTHFEGAQFLTEVQGGSDVGANAARAVQADDGTWRIYGEKWFCSNIDADVFLMTARPEGAPDGTRGLGLFFVPRNLEDGRVNEFRVRRLKDKIGTRSMASGECDFTGAHAVHMGTLGEGFKNMMALVINTSRIYNAVSTVAGARRAYVVAQTYAQHRRAFGQPIGEFPLVQETLADMRAEIDAAVSGTFHTVWLNDRIDEGSASEVERGFQRLAVNLNKMRTAKTNRESVVHGIEILGGNGAIETFSVLPRLLRDAIVSENWEGTHNTLLMQIYRDAKKYNIHKAFFAYLNELLQGGGAFADELTALTANFQGRFEDALEMPTGPATLALRPLLDEACFLFWAVAAQWQLQSAPDETAQASLEQFLEARLRGQRTRDSAYFERIRALASSF